MKHDNWNNEQYMNSKRQEVVNIAKDYLNKKIEYILAIRSLTYLKHKVSDDDFDQDFILFVAIDSETDHLPSNELRANCSESWLKKCDKEIKESEEFYRDQMNEACCKLIKRFERSA
ncbi:MAG: hypothetical protein HZA15_09170 [Nitrospirae bacterium]|nr:hypothetical protein [Nitrospirota bacterium]